MKIACVWEHNGGDTLLHAVALPGAFTRGASLEAAMEKMPAEAASYLDWLGADIPHEMTLEIVQDAACGLQVCDADTDVLLDADRAPLAPEEYAALKALALKSAADFQLLYESIPDKSKSNRSVRNTFYGQIPRTAEEMYLHTKHVNSYYFGEIAVEADQEGTILACRQRGFAALEKIPNFRSNRALEGSYGEWWTLRKMLRRFVWHDRIHAKAMYRMATAVFGVEAIRDPFRFGRRNHPEPLLPIQIIPYDEQYRDDLIFMVLEAKDALGRVPRLNEDLLDIPKHYLATGDGFWLAVDARGRVAGCVGYNAIPGTTEAVLHRLYVKAAYKRRGIGTQLLQTAESHLRRAGKTVVHVHLGGEAYWESRAFYPKRGYTATGPDWMQKAL